MTLEIPAPPRSARRTDAAASELLHCSKMLALHAAVDTSADRYAWAAHYLGEMAKAVVDDVANGMLPNGVAEEGDSVEV
ncbi:DUF3077 domain-containing protein [Pseudomonas fluorescens]|uniref:DUF3077 domain-containing protein n=1 Tax=Pseudomonas fluorescens TaxID=294 RepID=UPI001CD6C8CE|nr:DUF3077 domain-containing protein [Pseudomonas fluorescens]